MLRKLFRPRRTEKPGRRPARRPSLEALEDRWLPSTFLVTNVNDSGTGSLRQAILDSNATPGANTIDFSIGTGGAQTISPLSALPTVTVPTTIDGTSQPGFSGSPLIVLDGSSAGTGVNGLTITAGNSTVEGLVVDHFTASGIVLETHGGDVLQGNYVGTDSTGTAAAGNGDLGVFITTGANNNRIGGTTAAARNLISGNAVNALVIDGGATGNAVEGNYIGTDVTGTQAVGNGGPVFLGDAGTSNNTIGGTAAGAGNLISGNAINAVAIVSSASDNFVQGNLIGTDVTGTTALGNGSKGGDAVLLAGGAHDNVIGGTTAAAGNVISGNFNSGFQIGGTGTSGNVIEGNYVGTDVTGTQALGNGGQGLYVNNGASDNTIGGTTAAARNVISANGYSGVLMSDAGTTGNVIEGNYIGTDATGTAALGNSGSGLLVVGGAHGNLIGGTAAGAGNLISDNVWHAVEFSGSGTTGNLLQGNFIGTDVTGTAALGNGTDGVDTAVFIDSGASDNTVGGTAAGAGNLISGNVWNGLRIDGSSTTGNVVQGNTIGTDVTGTVALGNGADGVVISGGANKNTIGGTTAAARNLISANAVNGVEMSNPNLPVNPDKNLVQGNYIGTDVTGTVALGNGNDGVYVTGNAQGDTIGGSASARNLISGNAANGVELNAAFNLVQDNYIGTDATGTVALGNGSDGVLLSVQGDTVSGNVISANAVNGVEITGSGTLSRTLVQGNYVGTDLTGTVALGNGNDGVWVHDRGGSPTALGVLITGNVLSANTVNGVKISGTATDNNSVTNNKIGTDVTGTLALGNRNDGVSLAGGVGGNLISGNVISANSVNGVEISGSGTSFNKVQNNYIGTDVTGTLALGNANDGVLVDTGTRNSILSDLIFSSGNLGIELINGGNNGQAAPTLTAATSDGSSTTVQGTFTGAPGSTFTLQFFADSAANPSGSGEGQQLLGSVTVTTDASGFASFTVTFATAVPAGEFVSATATDSAGNTSPFAQDVTVSSS